MVKKNTVPHWHIVADGHWLLSTPTDFLAAVKLMPSGGYLAQTNDGRGRLMASLDDALGAAEELMAVCRDA